MSQRSWTLLVVPHGSDSPRTFTLTERALRIASGFAALVGIVAAIGIGVLVSTVGMPTSRIAQRENRLLSQELIDLKIRLRHLEDTLDVDVFSPPREDWINKTDAYLRGGGGASR